MRVSSIVRAIPAPVVNHPLTIKPLSWPSCFRKSLQSRALLAAESVLSILLSHEPVTRVGQCSSTVDGCFRNPTIADIECRNQSPTPTRLQRAWVARGAYLDEGLSLPLSLFSLFACFAIQRRATWHQPPARVPHSCQNTRPP